MTAKKTEKKAVKADGKTKVKKARATPKAATQAPKGASKEKRSKQTDGGAKLASTKSRKPAGKKRAVAKKLEARTGEDTFNTIQQEAYYLAERDGFRDDPVEYWLAAEVHLGLR